MVHPLTSPKRLHEFVAHTVQVNAVTIAPSHRLVATGGDDNVVNVWRVDNASNIASLAGHTSPVMCLTIDPASERFVAAGSEGGGIKVFDMASGKLVRSLTGHAAGVTCLNYDAAAGMLISGSLDASFKVWDVRTKKCVMHHKGHSTDVTDAQFSPDGRWCCSSGKDGVMNLWDLRDRETIYSFELETKQGKSSPILHFNFHPALPMLATSTGDRSLRLFHTDNFKLLASSSFPGETSPASAMAFDGHGHLCTATTNRLRVLKGDTLEVMGDAGAGATDAPWGNKVAMLSCHDGQLLAMGVRHNVVSLYTTQMDSPAAAETAVPAAAGSTARAALAAMEEETPLPQDMAFTPSRITRSVTRRASLLSPPPALSSDTGAVSASVAISAVAPAEEIGGGRLAPSQHPSKKCAASTVSSTSNNKSKQHQHDKENQSSTSTSNTISSTTTSSSRQAAGAPGGAKTSSTTTLTSQKKEEKVPLDPQARLSRADDEIIAGTMLHRKVLMGALSARLTHLQRLRDLWKKGRVKETFLLLYRLHEATPEDQGRLTVLADFLRAIDLIECAKECGPVTLEVSTPLLPVLASLLALDFEGHVLAGLKTMTSLLVLCGGDVREILRAPVGAGVDLSREERVEKCRVFHLAMQEAQERVQKLGGKEGGRVFKRSSPVHMAVEKAQRELTGFLNA